MRLRDEVEFSTEEPMIEAFVFLSENYWIIEVPILGGLTQAKRLSQIAPMFYDFYETWTQCRVDPTHFKITFINTISGQQYANFVSTDPRAFEAVARWRVKAEKYLTESCNREHCYCKGEWPA